MHVVMVVVWLRLSSVKVYHLSIKLHTKLAKCLPTQVAIGNTISYISFMLCLDKK